MKYETFSSFSMSSIGWANSSSIENQTSSNMWSGHIFHPFTLFAQIALAITHYCTVAFFCVSPIKWEFAPLNDLYTFKLKPNFCKSTVVLLLLTLYNLFKWICLWDMSRVIFVNLSELAISYSCCVCLRTSVCLLIRHYVFGTNASYFKICVLYTLLWVYIFSLSLAIAMPYNFPLSHVLRVWWVCLYLQ